MKKWLAMSILALSFNASAGNIVNIPCDFAQESGENFTFAPLDPQTRFKMRDNGTKYPRWVNDRFKPVQVQERDFAYRQGKLQKDYFYRRLESSGVTGEDQFYVRYYKATTEHCQTVWARIEESDTAFKKYFDQNDHQQNGDLPWEEVSELLHMQFSNTLLKLHAWKGKLITILPYTTKSKVYAKSKDQQRFVELNDFEEIVLSRVHPSSFIDQGKIVSTIQIEIKRKDGKEFLIPWDPERMIMGSPWKNKNLKSRHITDIKNNLVRFGMNGDEIKLSWGKPDYVRWLSKFPKEQEKYQWIKDDEFPYGAKFTKHRIANQDDRKRKGYYQTWHYSERLPEGHVLVIDDKNILDELNQTQSITPNTPHQPVALPIKN